MQYVKTKTILSSYTDNDRWFGYNYNMNLYRGCSHGCIYCDSRSDCYHVDNFDTVRAKENALSILEQQLLKNPKKGIIGVGAMSDSYNPFEKTEKLTRGALQIIDTYRFGIGLSTKSDLAVRDIDIFSCIKKHSPAMMKFTITCADDELSQKIEPFTAPSSKRFKAVYEFSKAGIYTGILLMPILPFINDTEKNIVSIVERAKDAGASFIFPSPQRGFGVTLRQNQRDYFLEKADFLYPGLKNRYIQTYGTSYECIIPDNSRIFDAFESACCKYGIIYKMSNIVHDFVTPYSAAEPEQYALF
ncbi:MAG TPA: radical SAM protein [Treponemataceae bacterium]|nr:radical SAM protein [Treponemataceae bacterium]